MPYIYDMYPMNEAKMFHSFMQSRGARIPEDYEMEKILSLMKRIPLSEDDSDIRNKRIGDDILKLVSLFKMDRYHSILDVGSGSGKISDYVGSVLDARVTHTDIKKFTPKTIVLENDDSFEGITKRNANGESTLVKYDIILLHQSAHHIKYLDIGAIKEMLTDDGIVVLYEHDVYRHATKLFLHLLHIVYDYNEGNKTNVFFRSKKDWIKSFKDAGFKLGYSCQPRGPQRKFCAIFSHIDLDMPKSNEDWSGIRALLSEKNIVMVRANSVSGKTFAARSYKNIIDGDTLVSWPSIPRWWLKGINPAKEQFVELMTYIYKLEKRKDLTFILWNPTPGLEKMCHFSIYISDVVFWYELLESRIIKNSMARFPQGEFKDYDAYMEGFKDAKAIPVITYGGLVELWMKL
jgi:2-polyprenyl-3-methyl-5-hydroxy-6-metoxy-1,4-benzoquinol methylase